MLDTANFVFSLAEKNLGIKNIFYSTDDHPEHRLLNAMQLDSCIPPHRHHGPDKDEAFVVLRGALGVLFNDAGEVVQTARVGAAALCVPGNPLRWKATALGVDIAHGAWNTDVALEADTVFLEAKAGPWPIGRRSPNGARAATGENPDYRRCADSTHKKDPRQDGFNMT